MIQPGDRIFSYNAHQGGDIAGVVALAIDVDFCDWEVAVYAGCPNARQTYEMFCVNELDTEVLERGCYFPPLPTAFADAIRKCANGAKAEAQAEWLNKVRPVIDVFRSSYQKNGFAAAIIGAREALLKQDQNCDVRATITEHLILKTLRENPPPKSTMPERKIMLAAMCMELDEVLQRR